MDNRTSVVVRVDANRPVAVYGGRGGPVVPANALTNEGMFLTNNGDYLTNG